MKWEVEEKIFDGWSEDEKFRVLLPSGEKALLRVSKAELWEKKQREFAALQQVRALNICASYPLECGRMQDGRVYLLFSWVEGEEAEAVVPRKTPEEQYALGYDAGKIVRKIHSIPAPKERKSWAEHFNAKIDRNIARYRECPIKVEGLELAIDYINANRHLLENRPQCLQHGDFHVGNMIVDARGDIWLIDFNRMDYGDPWEEFNRIPFSAKCSPQFAKGCMDGYFNGGVPEDFFRLLALYIASNQTASIPWAIPYGEADIAAMIAQAKETLADYDFFRRFIPRWYA